MLQANTLAPGEIVLQEVPKPIPKEDEVLIGGENCGICGSELHVYRGRHPFVSYPIVMGHEFSGVITEIGKRVRNLNIGDRVTIEPSLVCGTCFQCRSGRYNICESLKVMGFQTDGLFREFTPVPASKVLTLPDAISFEEGAMVEPLAVAVHAVRKSGLRKADKALILGSGTIGLMVLQVAKAYGAAHVIVVDINDFRLDFAQQLGADFTINPAKVKLTPELAQERLGEGGADVVFECVGVDATIRQAIDLARKGAKIVVAGVFEREVPLAVGLIQDRELEVLGTLMYTRQDFEEAFNLIESRKVRPRQLITHRFKFHQLPDAFQFIEENKNNVLKVMIEF